MRLHTLLYTLCLLHATADAVDPAPCDKTLITGFDPNTMKYDSNKLECQKPYQVLGYTDGTAKEAHFLTCDAAAGKWKDEAGVDTTLLATSGITVTCNEIACHEKRVTLEHGAIFTPPATPADHPTLSCPAPKQLTIEGGKYGELKCVKGTGWTESGATKFPDSKNFAADCEDPAPPAQTCATSIPAEVALDATNHVLKCVTAGKQLKLNLKYYASLTCTGGKWTDGQDADLGSAVVPLAVTCEDAPKCATSLTQAEGTVVNDVLKCITSGKKLKLNSKYYETLKCTGGIWADKDGTDLGSDSVKLDVTCEDEPCRNIKKPTTGGGAPEDGIADGVETSATGEYKCTRSTTPHEIIGIKLKDGFVKSKLFCDNDKGWTDFTKTANKYAGALEAVTLSCAKIPCAAGVGTPICTAFTSTVNPEPLPAGYECLGDNPSPFELTDNVWQLNCLKAQQKSQLYGLTTRTFYDYVPVCDKDDEKWHDPVKTTIIPDETNKLICLRKRCNSCVKLEEATGSPTASFYSEGTATACALATCPNNLWMIKREGATAEEEYAGEVSCSPDVATADKWITEEKAVIEKGSCVTSVKCTVATLLKTECDASWSASGCVAPTLSDDAAVSCKDKKMFYKKPEDKYFEDNATSMGCDKDKGHWKVTKSGGGGDKLKRGSSVVCADENPLPPPPPPPCTVCPNSTAAFIKTCDTCSDKDIEIKGNEGICEATVGFMNPIKFNTEKADIVEGKLHCGADRVWRSADGKEVGRFAAYNSGKSEEQQSMKPIIIAGAVGGAILLVIILIVVVKVIMGSRKRKTEEEKEKEEKKKRMQAEGKKRQKSRGNNDEILDEVSSQAPSEIKL